MTYNEALDIDQAAGATKGIDLALSTFNVSAIATPTGTPAWTTDVINGDHFTFATSGLAAIVGYPIVNVPMGDAFGLPVGLSFIGTAFSEPVLIALCGRLRACHACTSGAAALLDAAAQERQRHSAEATKAPRLASGDVGTITACDDHWGGGQSPAAPLPSAVGSCRSATIGSIPRRASVHGHSPRSRAVDKLHDVQADSRQRALGRLLSAAREPAPTHSRFASTDTNLHSGPD